MERVRWGIVGCGDVTEVKSGPGFRNANASKLVAVMRRDVGKAADYASRHGVPRFYGQAEALIEDAEVDAVYVATPPSSHLELALNVARAGKPCLVEKPMARNHSECQQMVAAFRKSGRPLFVAYYRRALPRFLRVRKLLKEGAVGELSSVHITHYDPLARGDAAIGWRYRPEISGGGLFMDLGSHGLDLLDFLVSPIKRVWGCATNTGGAYEAEDVVAAGFEFESGIVGTGIWNFNADFSEDRMTFTGSDGELHCPVFSDTDILLRRGGETTALEYRNPPHVHQPLIQTAVDELLGRGTCESTGESAARTGWVMDRCLKSYYEELSPAP